jgi:hypothetical protein
MTEIYAKFNAYSKNMEITQIQVTYLELDDRMLMRINLGENKHVAFLLTRRICRFMLENLNAFLGLTLQNESPPVPSMPLSSPQNPQEKDSLSPFAGLDLKTPFQERKLEDSILSTCHDKLFVLNAACNRGDGGVSFTFFIQDTESMNLNLPRKLALDIHQLMAGIAVHVQWFAGLTPINVNEVSQDAGDSEQTKTSVIYH